MPRFASPVLALLLGLALALGSAGPAVGQAADDPYEPTPYVKIEHPEWTKNATIYELNTRQFTEEGTFRAAQA
ncbi:MAG: hypothetical protein R3362_12430, partial [Rhodothermales bacterium]|nr:hypothetical protein [Rhodothermales bacterium]